MNLVYCLPFIFTGFPEYETAFVKGFILFSLVLALLATLALFFHDQLALFDKVIRDSAGKSFWSTVGGLILLIGGGILAGSMVIWNDERSNLEAARFLWDKGIFEYFKNYAEINGWLGSHHPPLLVMVYGLWYKLTGFSIVAGRIFNLAFALGASYITYLWVKKLADEAVARLAVLCLAFTPMWLFSSASALLDMPFVFFFMLSLFVFEKYI